MDAFERFRHPAWATSVATLVAYGLLLVLIAVVFFGVPFLVASAL